MADITAFPAIPGSIELANDVYSFTATAALKRGQAAAFHGTGVDFSVIVALQAGMVHLAGVAIEDADIGELVALKMYGPVIVMANESDSVAIDAGSEVTIDALGGVRAAAAGEHICGLTVEDMAADSYGSVMMYRDMFETA